MTDATDDAAQVRRAKYGQLPPVIRVEDTITGQDTESARDPDGGRDTNQDFTIRHAGG
jgi:hypothetical protein